MALLIYSTWPDVASARAAARALVQTKQIACANIAATGVSIYSWQNEVCEEAEVQMWMKTGATDLTSLRAAFLELHPFDLPAFVALRIDQNQSHTPFLDWLANEGEGQIDG